MYAQFYVISDLLIHILNPLSISFNALTLTPNNILSTVQITTINLIIDTILKSNFSLTFKL